MVGHSKVSSASAKTQNQHLRRRASSPSAISPSPSAGASPELPKRRRMVGKTPDTTSSTTTTAGKNIWDPNGNVEDLFGPEVQGALRVEKIFEMYGDPKHEYMDIPWFDAAGKEAVIADPRNRPLQMSTVAECEQRLFQSGLADDCSGNPDAVGTRYQ